MRKHIPISNILLKQYMIGISWRKFREQVLKIKNNIFNRWSLTLDIFLIIFVNISIRNRRIAGGEK